MRRRLMVAVLVLAVLLPPGSFAYACTTPIDTTSAASGLPRALLEKKNAVAWWVHVALGDALEVATCDRKATALQWVKASAHAATESDVRRASTGLAAVRARGDPSGVDVYLCSKLRDEGGFSNREQAEAARAAGLPCADLPVATSEVEGHWGGPPERALQRADRRHS